MIPDPVCVLTHYETFLARNYVWMAGGWEEGCEKNRRFFSRHGITPVRGGIAIDLGAGCGFQSVPLAEAGFQVVAVEFSRQMLAILAQYTGDLPVEMIQGNILSSGVWTGREPELITCMGDTLTHLPDIRAVRSLIRRCAHDLAPGGTIIFSFRDYSQEPEGSVAVIPVRRDADRIFLCRLEYDKETVRAEDILYSRESGPWVRAAGTYPKIRIAPEALVTLVSDEGLAAREPIEESGMVTIIAEKTCVP
jgi:SAM-dependent methyltransferase